MNAMAATNWLVVVGLLYLGCAFGLAAKAIASYPSEGSHAASRAARQRVDAAMALPFMLVGIVSLVAGQFYSGAMSGGVVSLAISLALALIVYAGLEGLVVESVRDEDHPLPHAQPSMLVAVAPPAEVERRPLQIVQG